MGVCCRHSAGEHQQYAASRGRGGAGSKVPPGHEERRTPNLEPHGPLNTLLPHLYPPPFILHLHDCQDPDRPDKSEAIRTLPPHPQHINSKHLTPPAITSQKSPMCRARLQQGLWQVKPPQSSPQNTYRRASLLLCLALLSPRLCPL